MVASQGMLVVNCSHGMGTVGTVVTRIFLLSSMAVLGTLAAEVLHMPKRFLALGVLLVFAAPGV